MQEFKILINQLNARDSENPDIQFKAAVALGEIKDEVARPEIIEALKKALGSEYQALTRAHSAQALGKLKASSAFETLIEALMDDYQLVRAYAAKALEELNNPKAIPALLDVLSNDPFFGARAQAAETLGSLCRISPDSPTTKEALSKLEEHAKKEREKNEANSKRVLRELFVALDEETRDVVEAVEDLKKTINGLENELGLKQFQLKKLRDSVNRLDKQVGDVANKIKAAI